MAGGREAASPVGVWSDLTRSGPEVGPRGVRPPDPPLGVLVGAQGRGRLLPGSQLLEPLSGGGQDRTGAGWSG